MGTFNGALISDCRPAATKWESGFNEESLLTFMSGQVFVV